MSDIQRQLKYFGIVPGVDPVAASSGAVANSAAVAAIAAVAGRTNYITGFDISGSGATAALPVTVTITGLLGGTLSYAYAFVAGVLVGNARLAVEFNPPIPASAANIAITLTCPAGGAGNTLNVANIRGFRV